MPSGKQAARKEQKKASKVDDEPQPIASGGLMGAMKELVVGSVLFQVGPTLPDLLKDAAPPAEVAAKVEEKKDEGDEGENTATDEAKTQDEQPISAASVFETLGARLPFYNALGLGRPATGDEAKFAWTSFKELEVDGGPKSRKKGNPAMERIMVNLERNMSQYLHILLVLMCSRAFLFRSFFACLPWLVGYQVLSLKLPLDLIRAKFPQVPPIEFKFRVAASVGIHALMWVFFLFEFVYKTYFVEKLLLTIAFVVHAYVVSPILN